MRIVGLAIAVCLLVPGSCKKAVKPSEVPAYLYIDKIDLQTGAGEGTDKHGITDAWVYADGKSIGVFELPATVPILTEGNTDIWVYGGIKKDGISTTRVKYPFYQPYKTTAINFQRGHVDSLSGSNSPVVHYYPSNNITIWEEAFDDPGIEFQADAASQGQMVYHTTAGEVFEGNGSGLMELDANQTQSKFITTQSFPLPKFGNSVFVELHYRSNNAMVIGMQAINGTEITTVDNLVIRSSDGVWKKIYIDFTDLVSQQVNASTFKFYILILKESGVTTVYNLVDNFKLVYAQ